MPNPDLAKNLVLTFREVAAEESARPFLWCKRGGVWEPWSWSRVAEEVSLIARALVAQGIERGDRVLLVAENRPEWLIADLAVMTAGGVTVPAYTTNTTADHAYLLDHSGATMVVCSTAALAGRLVPAVREAPAVRAMLFIDTPPGIKEMPVPALGWQEALELGRASTPAKDLGPEFGHDDIACFIYTSGTGGRPKGVMLSHGNILANVRGARDLLRIVGADDHDVFLSFLPLSHSYEHTAGQFLPMGIGAQIYYAESVDSLSANLLEARPTILTCVPRLYEVLRQKILVGVKRQGGLKARLFDLALELGARRYEQGALPPHLMLADKTLDLLVRRKVSARFGGRLKAMVSGGAPLSYEVGRFFVALGLPVIQGYGQTEASPVISANLPGRTRIDTVGPPLPGVEVKIAEDGEILVRGANVMRGYWRDEAATAETIRDGWLHTGDVGELDALGNLKITDRKKDLIVNSGGENISPQRVEGIALLQPEIGQALIFGDRRPHLVALVVPDSDLVRRYALETGNDPDLRILADDPAFQARIGEAIKRANASLSVLERIRRFHVMNEPFTVDNGLMTPTLKLRRPLIIERYRNIIEGLYRAEK